jgi:type IV pilus assembly protein PilA
MRNRNQAGFSLIELLIVVAIILIIAAVAIPNYLRAKMQANEASVVQSMRIIQTSETAYAIAYPSVGYSPSLNELSDGGASPCTPAMAAACLIDSLLATGIKDGYTIVYANDGNTPSFNYTIHADPFNRGTTGQRSFFSDYPGVIHYNDSAAATSTDPPLQ